MKYFLIYSFLILFVSCKQNSTESLVADLNVEYPESFIDKRDGNEYHVIAVNNQIWMAENLRYKVDSGSYCYNDDEENCAQGRIYTWEAAMAGDTLEGSRGICPEGWHLPTGDEWDILIASVGGDSMGSMLKEGGIGFDAKLNGGRMQNADGTFNYMRRGSDVCYWTSESDGDMAFDRNLNALNQEISKRVYPKEYGFCVRCIKDEI